MKNKTHICAAKRRVVVQHFGIKGPPPKLSHLVALIRKVRPDLVIEREGQRGRWETISAFADSLGVEIPPSPQVKKSRKLPKVASDDFLQTYEWRRLRMEVIIERGRRCECCGATPEDPGVRINVDHIKPRRLYPELALEKSNLQILCNACNHGKGNWDETDWRSSPAP